MFEIISRVDNDNLGMTIITISSPNNRGCFTLVSHADGYDQLTNPFGQIFDLSQDWSTLPIAIQELALWIVEHI